MVTKAAVEKYITEATTGHTIEIKHTAIEVDPQTLNPKP
jgi:hypothetical protein